MKRIIPTIITFVALIITFAPEDPWMGSTVETWQTGNQNFKLRIDRRTEICPYMCGAYYIYRYQPPGSSNWRDIFTIFQDEPHSIRRDQVNVLTDQIGYVFHASRYAVSLDGGLSWSVWEIDGRFPFERYKAYPYIGGVNIQADGVGTMWLNYVPISDEGVSLPTLYTEDYGRSWVIRLPHIAAAQHRHAADRIQRASHR